MAVQVSFPGVYVEEFTPGNPIQGVGTNTAAFVGTALSGPIGKPTLIQSWDAFVATFGGFVTTATSYLAPAVYGFFLNGGTTCYVVRAGTGKMAQIGLDDREATPSPPPALVATAIQEGGAGNAVTIEVDESSQLAAEVTRALPLLNVSAVSGDRKTLTVDKVTDYARGDAVTLAKGSDSEAATIDTIDSSVSPPTILLVAAIPGGVDFTGGTVTAGSGGGATPVRVAVRVRDAQANVTAMPDRVTLMVDALHGLAPGDQVLLSKGADSAAAAIKSATGTTLTLTQPVSGAVDFSGGTVRIADLAVGQTTFRLDKPSGLALNQTLPQGSLVEIALGGTSEFASVAASGGDTITLVHGLANAYSLANPADLPSVASAEFDLMVTDPGPGTTESFRCLSMDPSHPRYWEKIVTSQVVTLAPPASPSPTPPPDPRPKAAKYQLAGGTPDDPNAALNAVLANPASSLDTLKPYDDVNLVAVPGVTDPGVQQAVIAHCETMHDRFAILDSEKGAAPGNGIRDQFAGVRSADGFAALYYPWLVVRNPSTGKNELWPPSGHVAGVYARTDQQRGVHKAPANANVVGALGLERRLTDAEQGDLNLMGINVIRVFPGQSQPIVWGARTTSGDLDRNWQYVNVRRLFLFLEESIQDGIRWAIFEPNNLALWQKLKRSITEFLTQVWRDGALFGETADKAFYVRIDEALNPPSTQALGKLYIEVGVRPTYPAEFIVLRIGIWQGGSEVSES
jgi:phage tail sheath protein FI